jgi:hypothetical protein
MKKKMKVIIIGVILLILGLGRAALAGYFFELAQYQHQQHQSLPHYNYTLTFVSVVGSLVSILGLLILVFSYVITNSIVNPIVTGIKAASMTGSAKELEQFREDYNRANEFLKGERS